MNRKGCNNGGNKQFTVSMLPGDSISNVSIIEPVPEVLFNLHRRFALFPILKRNISLKELMKWESVPLKESLSLSAKNQKDFVRKIDNIINEIIRKKCHTASQNYYELINELLHLGLFEIKGLMRDEIYLQLMRQINGIMSNNDSTNINNANIQESQNAWKLMICVTAAFPPTKGLCPYVLRWFDETNKSTDSINFTFIKSSLLCCYCNLNVFRISGPRGYSTSIADVKFWFDESYLKIPIFGIELEQIYEEPELLETKTLNDSEIQIPRVVVKLIQMIRDLNGFQKEGIFRVSGDLQQVFQLKNLLSKDLDDINISSTIFKDASVPASTLKLWMRVLRSPLIPDHLFPQILSVHKDSRRLGILLEEVLPRPNYAVVAYICNFLLEMAQPKYQELTKMTLDNFSMIFTPCFMRCPLTASALEVLRKSSEERQILKEIFNHFLSLKSKS